MSLNWSTRTIKSRLCSSKNYKLGSLQLANKLPRQANIALNHASMGVVMVPTVVVYSQTLSKLAIGLDKRPDLLATVSTDQSDTGERVTLVEASANVIKESCLRCLNDRVGGANGLDSNGTIAGRKIGTYALANISLRLFFYCKRLRSAEQVFHNIQQTSKGPSGVPPLRLFPAAQRVTYLYFLGRYFFANTHFYFAQKTLQAAYDQCHRQAFSQRRKILIYLCLSNILLGRFPSQTLLSRPEADGLGNHLLPVCQAIKLGNITTFQTLLALPHSTASIMYHWRAALQFQTFGMTLVQRSLARRTFLLNGVHPEPGSKQAPNFAISDLRILQAILEHKAISNHAPAEFQHPFPFWPSAYIASDSALSDFSVNIPFAGSSQNNNSGEEESDGEDNENRSSRKIIPRRRRRDPEQKSLANIESDVAVLAQKGYLHGYLNHKHGRFVISGAKNTAKSPAEVGFPRVWDVATKGLANEELPGWYQG